MQCGSGIDSINHAASKILCNQSDIVIAGGMESWSQCTVKFPTSFAPYKFITPAAFVPILSPDLEEGDTNMGITAERLQQIYAIPRNDQDQFALRSQTLARQAVEAGYFQGEIIPVSVPQGKQPPQMFQKDEPPAPQRLRRLPN